MVAIFAIALAYFILGTTSEVFAFCNVPTITSISSASGSTSGGTSVTITGTDFGCGVNPAVKFGSNLASFTLLSDTQITATSPPGVGTADVTVTTDGGTSPTSAADQFTYTASPPTVTSISPNSGLAIGGMAVEIFGTNFIGVTSVKFGSTSAVFIVLDPTRIAVTAPAGNGTVDVTVTTAAGTSGTSPATKFTYVRGQSIVSLVSSLNPSQFGQSVTFVAAITVFSGQPSGTVTFKDNGTTLTTVALSAGSASYATASLTRGSHSISATYNGDGNFEGSTSAALVQAVNVPADSVKLKALQNQVSPLVAQISAAAVTGAIDGAIGDAFGNGGDAVTMGPNGMTLNFTAAPRSEVTRRADAAFATLAYGTSSNVNKAPPLSPTKEREWSVWTNLRGTGWESNNNSTADLKGSQLNLTAGIGRKFTPDLLVGIVAGYEQFKYDSVALGGTVKGNGGTVGSYAAWRFAPTLRWDATLAWSAISYDAVAGTASGNFIGHRWLASTGLTGNYHLASFVFEPSAKVYALWERQGEWTDSLGTPQTARSFSAGQVATGGKVSAPWQLSSSRVTVAPYVGFYGDWRFKSDDAVPAGQPVVGIGNGWSGRVTSGISVVKAGGGMLALGGEYGGIGANYKVWTANGRVSWRF